jgi:hypothetical protein
MLKRANMFLRQCEDAFARFVPPQAERKRARPLAHFGAGQNERVSKTYLRITFHREVFHNNSTYIPLNHKTPE